MDRVRVELEGTAVAGGRSDLGFAFTDAPPAVRWTQFRLADGDVISAPFTVEAR